MRAVNAGKLVVVIDDDPPVLETTASLLRSSGFQVVAAESYTEAMDRLSKLGRRADLIVCGAITESCSRPGHGTLCYARSQILRASQKRSQGSSSAVRGIGSMITGRVLVEVRLASSALMGRVAEWYQTRVLTSEMQEQDWRPS